MGEGLDDLGPSCELGFMSKYKPIALVTGASRGFGRAIALELGGAGFRVALVARSRSGLEETARQAEQRGVETLRLPADLSVAAETSSLAEALRAWGGELEVLVNNAGVIAPLGSFLEVRFEDWAASLRTNVEGTARLTHAVLPLLSQARRASIITISSGAAVSDIPGWSAYCTAKAALDRWALVLDAELKETGIRSYSFAPGTIETEMQKSIRSSGVGPARLVSGEVEHLPAEVPAKAVVFLTSPEAEPFAGRHIDIRYPEVRKVLGLPEL